MMFSFDFFVTKMPKFTIRKITLSITCWKYENKIGQIHMPKALLVFSQVGWF